MTVEKGKPSTRMGFEPTRAEPNGLAVHRLNHSATSSASLKVAHFQILKEILFCIILLTIVC